MAFTRGYELTMMRYVYGFRLIDARDRILERFRELSGPVDHAVWSPDSRIGAIPVDDGLLLYGRPLRPLGPPTNPALRR